MTNTTQASASIARTNRPIGPNTTSPEAKIARLEAELAEAKAREQAPSVPVKLATLILNGNFYDAEGLAGFSLEDLTKRARQLEDSGNTVSLRYLPAATVCAAVDAQSLLLTCRHDVLRHMHGKVGSFSNLEAEQWDRYHAICNLRNDMSVSVAI